MTRFPTFRDDGTGLVSARFRGDLDAISAAVDRWFDEDDARRRTLLEDAGSLPQLEIRREHVALVQGLTEGSRLWLGYLVYLVKFVEEESDSTFDGFWDEIVGQPHSSRQPDDDIK